MGALLSSVSALAALFHDIGKAFLRFQTKILKNQQMADLIRHELMSYGVMNAMFEAAGGSDDGWLEALSKPSTAAKLVEAGFRAFAKSPLRFMFSGADSKKDTSSDMARIATADEVNLSGMNAAMLAKRPKFTMVAALVLTHHRLPGGQADRFGMSMTKEHLVSDYSDLLKNDAQTWGIPINTDGLWASKEWIESVSSAADELRDALISDHRLALQVVATYGRTALILGDHKASSIGSAKVAQETAGRLYANTNRKGPASVHGHPAEYLDDHLISVANQTLAALNLLTESSDALLSVPSAAIPEPVLAPEGEAGSSYRWQFEAAKAIRDSPDYADKAARGFFGILMAGTGSGKTRAAPIILAAASGHDPSLRFVMASGLRSLTLQSGDAYRHELGFREEDVSVVIGDSLVSELHQLRKNDTEVQSSVGTEAEDGDRHIVANCAAAPRFMPTLFGRFFAKDGILPAPVLISTIDTIMTAADARGGRHTEAMMRVATSDLVIDEIDDFGEEDLAAITRLCRLCGTFGRRLILSSATISPVIATAMYQAYSDGWQAHAAAFGKDSSINGAWFSEFEGTCRTHRVNDISAFRERHHAFAHDVADGISRATVRRKAKFVTIDTSTAGPREFFEKVSGVLLGAHHENHVFDDLTGKRVSVGVVKWNNVLPSFLHAQHLLNVGLGSGITLRVMPYNGSLMLVVRDKFEGTLDKMLSRKGDRDPLLSYPAVRAILDDPLSGQDVVVIVVTTSMEEVGRDHDFDWALVDPGSYRSLVQIAGRVRRHRHGPWDRSNVFVLNLPFRSHRLSWEGGDRLVYAFPGVETPLRGIAAGPKFRPTDAFKLPERDAREIYGSKVERGIDASDIVLPNGSMSELARREAYRVSTCLDDGFGLPLSVEAHNADPFSSLTAYHPTNRRFRRKSGEDLLFEFRLDDEDWYTAKQERGRQVLRKQNDLVSEVACDMSRLLVHVGPLEQEVDAIMTRLGCDKAGWQRTALTSVRKCIFGNVDRSSFAFNPVLGFCDLKGFSSNQSC